MTTDQAAPAAANPQAAQGRRDAIDHLLFRAACGVIKAEEGALLRTLVEQERDAGDSLAGGVSASAATYARRYEQAAERLRKARQQRTEAREEADRLRRTIERIAEAPLNVDVWARLGMALGWTPERVGAEARKRRLHGEQQLAATADSLRQQLAAAKAEAEGLAETMRNTDRLTEQQLADTRSALRAERGRADNLGAQFRDRRHALSDALGLGTSAPWDAITERARELHALTETAGTAVSASDVLVQHDVTRKAMCDALGVGYHLNWQQIIDAAQRSHNANAEWQRESEQHRHALAEALACFPTTTWADLPSIAAERITQRQRAQDRAQAAERHAAADVAAARQAEELAGRTLAMRHQRLAEALHCDLGTSWRDLIQLAGDRTGVVAAMRQTVTRAEQNAAAARQGEAEAVRARQAAEAQRRDVVATLRETETQLGQARKVRDQHAGTIERMKRTNRMVNGGAREALERAEQAEAAIARVRKATAALTPLAARHIEEAIAEPEPKPREVCCACGCPDVTYHNHREQPLCCRCAMCCEPPTLCAHGCQPADATAEAEEQREQPAVHLLRGIDLTGYTAGMQAFMTAYVRAVAPALDQVARALGVDQDRR